MALRANWKGLLKVAELTCPVGLYTAASTSERLAFHTINRATGHRVHRQFVDAVTGKPVEKDDQVKGYEVGQGDYIILEEEEIAEAVPETDKALSIIGFIDCSEIDDLYFDKPYYLVPTDQHAEEAFDLIRDGMRKKKVAALARAVLFRRVRTLLVRAYGHGLVATTLKFDYEVRPPKEAFDGLPSVEIKGEMAELAEHIIKTKMGKFDISKFSDRYEVALEKLVKAKLEGATIEISKEPKREKVIDLMEALRESARITKQKKAPAKAAKAPRSRSGRTAASRRKAG